MHKFLVCPYKSQDFAQSHTDFAQSHKIFSWLHDRETVTFRNSDYIYLRVHSQRPSLYYYSKCKKIRLTMIF